MEEDLNCQSCSFLGEQADYSGMLQFEVDGLEVARARPGPHSGHREGANSPGPL